MPTFDSTGKPIDVESDFLQLSNLSASGTNARLLPMTDVGMYRRISLQLAGPFTGSLAFMCNNTGVAADDVSLFMQEIATGIFLSGLTFLGNSAPHIYTAPINFRYMEIYLVSWVSGTVTGTVELFSTPAAVDPYFVTQLNLPGTGLTGWNADPGNAGRVSLYGTNSVAGDTKLRLGIEGGLSNDGISNTVIAASKATDTVIKASAGRLASILVTTAGTTEMDVYDNASAGSGSIIGLVPAAATVTGVPYVLKAPALNGITVKGNAGNPAVTISYT